MSAAEKNLPALAGPAPALCKAQKAALVLAHLNAEAAKAVVAQISDAHLAAMGKALPRLDSISAPLLREIFLEFATEVEHSAASVNGGLDKALEIITSVSDEERAGRIAAMIGDSAQQSVWARVEAIDDETLLDYLQKQKGAIAATILQQLKFEKTASVLAAAPVEYAQSILVHLTHPTPPRAEAIDEIAAAVEAELIAPAKAAGNPLQASGHLAEVLNLLPSERRRQMLTCLDEADADIAASVRKALISFEDLSTRLTEAGAAALLRTVAKEDLITALKFGETNAGETVTFLLANISKRMAEQYRTEMSEMAEIDETNGEAAQRAVIVALKNLVAQGEVTLNAPAAAEAEQQ